MASVMAAPEVLSIVVPTAIVKVPVPKAPALLISKVPAFKFRPPLKLLLPVRIKVPEPASLKLNPPLIIPPSVKVAEPFVIVTVEFALNVTAPVPRFKLDVPVKVKLPLQFWTLLLERVIAAPEVLSKVPPDKFKAPVPIAVALLMFNVPPLMLVLPIVLACERVTVPLDWL